MKKNVIVALLLVLLGTGGNGFYITSVQATEFCFEHQIAEKDCPWCDPSLVEKMGWCPEHGVPEALCSRCNPALIAGFEAEGDWCAGHDVPESQCTICNPGLLADRAEDEMDDEMPAESSPIQLVRAAEASRSQRLPSVTCRIHSQRVQFLSPEIAHGAGLEYMRVERREITQTLTCNAEIAYDGNRYAHLSSRAPGIVREVKKDLGQTVEGREVLAIVDSADLGTAKAEYLQAQALLNLWERNHAREERLQESNVTTEQDVLEAETKLAESRIALSRATQRLRNLGLSDAQIREIAKIKDTTSFLPLTATFSGIVVERSGALGEVVDTQRALFAIADTSAMWAMLDVYESDVQKVRIGQPVVFEAEGLPGERRGGRVTWISSHVDRRTRTLKVRAEVANPDGLLRAGMFGKAIISIRDGEPALIVPKDAVQWEGCCNVVFVKRSDVLFEPRKVRLGYETERFFVVEEGVAMDEVIVTTGSFLLKTEILKGSIGAGCCEVAPGKN